MTYNTVLIVCTSGIVDYQDYPNSYVIGVERGCLDLISKNIPIDLACGDFDKLTREEYELVQEKAKKISKYDSHKDYIDGEIAVKYALEIDAKKIVLVSSGERFDMSLSCFSMVNTYNLEWISNNDYVIALQKGKNKLRNIKGYNYLSLFALQKSKINIYDMKYNVENFTLENLSINAVSNEFISEFGTVEVLSGKVIAIYTK